MTVTVSVGQKPIMAILEGARRIHPRETILLLRGKKKEHLIEISDLLVPPLATHGKGFASVPLHMLPMDFSILGTVHSHPSGNLEPSIADLNHFFGTILMIVASPYKGEGNVAVYDHQGKKLILQVKETQAT